jgi:TPP-dependent 2-oxoacid decarboxylase
MFGNERLVTLNRYEFQMQYGSIGWSVGATLGYAQAAKDKRVIACIGDGSFQVRIHPSELSQVLCFFFSHGVPVCSRAALVRPGVCPAGR